MKTRILSVCVIAGLFAGCSELNLPTLSTPANNQVNKELIKGIKTDGKGGYYVMSEEDCDKLLKAGVFIDKRYSASREMNYCERVAHDNLMADAMNTSFGGEKKYHNLKVYKPYEAVK